jgi:hypothetical protein
MIYSFKLYNFINRRVATARKFEKTLTVVANENTELKM